MDALYGWWAKSKENSLSLSLSSIFSLPSLFPPLQIFAYHLVSEQPSSACFLNTMPQIDDVQQQLQQSIDELQGQLQSQSEQVQEQLAAQRETHERALAQLKELITGLSMQVMQLSSRVPDPLNREVIISPGYLKLTFLNLRVRMCKVGFTNASNSLNWMLLGKIGR